MNFIEGVLSVTEDASKACLGQSVISSKPFLLVLLNYSSPCGGFIRKGSKPGQNKYLYYSDFAKVPTQEDIEKCINLSNAAGLTTTPFYTGTIIGVSSISQGGIAHTGYNGTFVVTGFAGTTTVSYATTG